MKKILLCLGIAAFLADGFCTDSRSLKNETFYDKAMENLNCAMNSLANLKADEMYFNEKLTDQIQMLTRFMVEEDIYYKAMINKNPTVDVLKECLNYLKTQLKNKSISEEKAGDVSRLMTDFAEINRLGNSYYRTTEESAEEIKAREKKAEKLRKKVLKNGVLKKNIKNISEYQKYVYLIDAIEFGCEDVANILIDEYDLPVEYFLGGLKCNTVIYAASRGRINILKHMLESKKSYRNALKERETHTRSLLNAAAGGHNDVIRYLVSGKWIDVNDRPGADALTMAACNGHVRTVRLLIDLGAENLVDALVWATYQGKLEVVKLLLEKGADPNAENSNGTTAIKAAESCKRGKAFMDLLQKNK